VDITLNWALDRLDAVTHEWHRQNVKYYNGDHWQNGLGWAGPAPSETTEGYHAVIDEINRGFVSKNAIKEVADRHMNAVLGREPAWTLLPNRPLADEESPTAAELALISEAEALVVDWYDARGIHKLLQEAVVSALLTDRGCLRIFIPMGLLDESGQVPVGTLQESINKIYLTRPEPDACMVFVDQNTMEGYGIFSYTAQNGAQRAEVCYNDGRDTVIKLVQRGGNTVGMEVVPSDTLVPDVDEFRFQLGGNLTIYELRCQHLITDQVRQLQKMLNMILSMASRNAVIGGFLERTILNAQMPGQWVEDSSSPEGRVFKPDPVRLGAGSVNFISGLEVTGADGSKSYASPQVQYRDPVSVLTFKDSSYLAYRSILEEVHQVHSLLAGEAAPSGESRRQAIADFTADLRLTASRANAAGRWLIETVLALTALLAGQPNRYASLRVDFNARVDTGPTSADIQQLVINQRNAGLLSLETAMVRSDVDDPDAELAKINTEKQAEVAAKFFMNRGEDAPDLTGLDPAAVSAISDIGIQPEQIGVTE
jgi:hypothetical protein